jgi:hypothetical protein
LFEIAQTNIVPAIIKVMVAILGLSPLETEETTAGMDRTPRARPTTKRVSGSMTDMLPLVTQWGDYSGSVL